MADTNFEDILNGVAKDTTTTTVEAPTNNSGQSTFRRPKAFSPFDDEVTLEEVNLDTLKKHARMFTGSSPVAVPNDKLEVLDRIVAKCNTAGFTFRSLGDNQDHLNTNLTERVDRKEFYLPWAKFNIAIDAKMSKPSEKAYKVSCWLSTAKREAINNAKGNNVPREDIVKDFNLLSPAVKTFSARNVHMMLGDDCETALNFMLVYTECGSEKPVEIKWDLAGKTGNMIEIADRLGIPVFNLAKPACEVRLTEFLETFK